MLIASVRSASEAPSYPLRQNTVIARSSAVSVQKLRGRPVLMAFPLLLYWMIHNDLDGSIPAPISVSVDTEFGGQAHVAHRRPDEDGELQSGWRPARLR